MESVTVKKQALLEALKTNRANHRNEFLKAQQGWRQTIIDELDKRLVDARAGRHFNATFMYPEPEDHTKDYDRVILMVEMDVRDTIELPEYDFACYVMDDWKWKQMWSASNVSYINRVVASK